MEYVGNASPTGHETKGQELWLDYISPYVHEWHTDVYGTAYGVINPGKKYKVVIESHADEISWYVNYISDKGNIHVIRNGGSDQTIAASRRVNRQRTNDRLTVGTPASLWGRISHHTPFVRTTCHGDGTFADPNARSGRLGGRLLNSATFFDTAETRHGRSRRAA